jgi:hypothetical protein
VEAVYSFLSFICVLVTNKGKTSRLASPNKTRFYFRQMLEVAIPGESNRMEKEKLQFYLRSLGMKTSTTLPYLSKRGKRSSALVPGENACETKGKGEKETESGEEPCHQIRHRS